MVAFRHVWPFGTTGDTIMVKSIFCFSSEKDLYL